MPDTDKYEILVLGNGEAGRYLTVRQTPERLPAERSFFTSSARPFFAPSESQYESVFTAELGEADSVGGRRSQTRFQ